MKRYIIHILILSSLAFLYASMSNERYQFQQVNTSTDWQLEMLDSCTDVWHKCWFLDGKKASIVHSPLGMDFRAGPINRNDEHHAVLWTKQSFTGDVKIEYDYTRTDSQLVNVNILYIQATGTGEGSFEKDISLWSDYREVPTMSKYYYHMNALHISYAAFKMKNQNPEADYIRVRKYPAEKGKFRDTALGPDYFNTHLFRTGKTYHISIIKEDRHLYMNVEDQGKEHLFSWKLNESQKVEGGRIGLRHMFTRSSRYYNFRVYTK